MQRVTANSGSVGTNAIVLEAVSKTYPRQPNPAVDQITLEVQQGETLAILGPSGCGKSTLLRLMAGLERADAGRVWLMGRDVTGWPPERRGVGLVFQDGALFPHRTVAGNVAYGLEEHGLGRMETQHRVNTALERVRIARLATRRIQELSGGERQRVALARALAPEPDVLLLDEPFSNLDEALRGELREELRGLFKELGLTALLVTHDQRDAFALADRVAIMRAGRLVQVGSPRTVFEKPVSAWVARFLGHRNVLEPANAARLGLGCSPSECVLVPDGAIMLNEGPSAETVQLATVRSLAFEGRSSHVTLEVQGVMLAVETMLEFQPGDSVQVRLEPRAVQVLPA